MRFDEATPQRILKRGEQMDIDGDSTYTQPPQEGRRLKQELANLKDVATARMFETILDAPITTNVKTLLASSDSVQKAFFTRMPAATDNTGVKPKYFATPIKAADDEDEADIQEEQPEMPTFSLNAAALDIRGFVSPCAYADIGLNGCQEIALLDEGSEINAIDLDIALNAGIGVGPDLPVFIKGFQSGGGKPIGTATKVLISFGGVPMSTEFLVFDGLRTGVILGRPWASKARFGKKEGEGFWDCQIHDEATDFTTRFRVPLRMGHEIEKEREERKRAEKLAKDKSLNL
jgi:hypothetical protein